ncbi:MAG: YigZ family protein [Lachnospiraceae bacterium]|nr:YigZ family protein [Lachnospiraceae bacterium]
MNVLSDKINMNRAEIVVKKSRFIASIFYVENEDIVKDKINALKKEFYDARHHVYAYIVGDKKKQSDDGEPQGTGGKPILSLLEGKDMTNCLIVVSRIFGGVLLGTGGLAHAYGDAAKMVLDGSDIKELISGKKVEVKFSYEYLSYVKSAIAMIEKSKVENIEYGDVVYMMIDIPYDNEKELDTRLNDATKGTIDICNTMEIQYTV